MNEQKHYLEHAGLVTDFYNGRLKIELTGSGCSACHKSLCLLGDSKSKEVEISCGHSQFIAGEEVVVRINPASGYKAVVLLYLLPFLLMVMTLIIFQYMGYRESLAGVLSLLILAPYFLLVYGLRKKISSQCYIDVLKR